MVLVPLTQNNTVRLSIILHVQYYHKCIQQQMVEAIISII